MKAGVFIIGADDKGEKVVGSKETRKQIARVKELVCGLQHEGEELDWDTFDDPAEPRTIFQSILRDREMRVDRGQFMADRPPFVVVTAVGNRAVRLEYYEGHDALKLVYDIRANELEGKDLPRWMEEDPQAYDPVAFLEEVFGIPREISQPILDAVHEEGDE